MRPLTQTGGINGMPEKVSSTSLKSLRLAGPTAIPTGTPEPSVISERFVPSFARSTGEGPVFFPAERRFGDAAVHRKPAPVEALDLVVLLKAALPEVLEDTKLRPLLESVVGRGAGTDEGGVERLPLATGAQHEEDGVETDAVIGARPAATKRIGTDVLGNERRKAQPERFGNPPAIVFDFVNTLARRHGRLASKGLMQGNRQNSGRDFRVSRIGS